MDSTLSPAPAVTSTVDERFVGKRVRVKVRVRNGVRVRVRVRARARVRVDSVRVKGLT